jgi:hypothetical protein
MQAPSGFTGLILGSDIDRGRFIDIVKNQISQVDAAIDQKISSATTDTLRKWENMLEKYSALSTILLLLIRQHLNFISSLPVVQVSETDRSQDSAELNLRESISRHRADIIKLCLEKKALQNKLKFWRLRRKKADSDHRIASRQLRSAERRLSELRLVLNHQTKKDRAPTVDVEVGEDSFNLPDSDYEIRISSVIAAEKRRLRLLKRELDQLMRRVESSLPEDDHLDQSENYSYNDTET